MRQEHELASMRTPCLTSLADAAAELVHDGDTVALEGFTHLIPVAAGRELIRQGRRDLTLVRMTPDVIYDLPRWAVTRVAVVPGGARSSYAHGYYDRDNAYYRAWDEISRDRDRFRAWLDELEGVPV